MSVCCDFIKVIFKLKKKVLNTGIKAKPIFLIYIDIGEKKLKAAKKAKTDEYDSGVGDDHAAEATATTPDFDVAALNKILAQEKKQSSSEKAPNMENEENTENAPNSEKAPNTENAQRKYAAPIQKKKREFATK